MYQVLHDTNNVTDSGCHSVSAVHSCRVVAPVGPLAVAVLLQVQNCSLLLDPVFEIKAAALDISTGPLARRTFQTAWPVRASTFIFLSFTGPYGPSRYMSGGSGHEISNSAGLNDDKSQYVLFARATVPHLGSFCTVLLLQRDASMSRIGVGHVNQTH